MIFNDRRVGECSKPMKKEHRPLGNTEKDQDRPLEAAPKEDMCEEMRGTARDPVERHVPHARGGQEKRPNTAYLPKKPGSKEGERAVGCRGIRNK